MTNPYDPQQKVAALGGAPPGAPPAAPANTSTGVTQGPNNIVPQIPPGMPGAGTANKLLNMFPGYQQLKGLTSPAQADLSGINAQTQRENALSDSLGAERAGMGAPTLDQGNADQSRAKQNMVLNMLMGAANGTAPSAADLQAEKDRQANVANQLGLAAASRGHSAGGALYNAAEGTADINSQAAGNAAINRANEQNQARQLLATTLGNQRSQDIDQAAKAAGLSNDQYLALLNGQIQALGGGTTAQTAAVNAASANAAAQNKANGGIMQALGGAIGL